MRTGLSLEMECALGHDWIIDVLADLKSFAEANDMGQLAAQLDETTRVASAQIDALAAGPVAIKTD